jgi:hypothetical protein
MEDSEIVMKYIEKICDVHLSNYFQKREITTWRPREIYVPVYTSIYLCLCNEGNWWTT